MSENKSWVSWDDHETITKKNKKNKNIKNILNSNDCVRLTQSKKESEGGKNVKGDIKNPMTLLLLLLLLLKFVITRLSIEIQHTMFWICQNIFNWE